MSQPAAVWLEKGWCVGGGWGLVWAGVEVGLLCLKGPMLVNEQSPWPTPPTKDHVLVMEHALGM